MMSKNRKGRRGPGMTNVQRVLNMREREANTNAPQKVTTRLLLIYVKE